MFALLRQRNFGLLWFAGAASLLGDWALMVALPFFVYDLTGSALATGLTFMAQTLPRVLLGSVAGVFVDRWDRRKTLVVADAARGLLLLLLLLVRSTDTLWSSTSSRCSSPRSGSSSYPPRARSCRAWSARTNWSPPTP